ncbi:oligoendopeptidase F [Mycoplasmopsis iners]|uniref:oligoendopeptidase F n=1 Tax=Mycoplasmopsis iners TaxID=76630 RepID=UPI0004971AFC|nr:oligoendopeptidase F [Mycoplasmopsis iners]
MKQYKNIKDVETKYKFDLEDILKGKTFEEWLNIYQANLNELLKLKDTKYQNIEEYIKYLKLSDQVELVSNKLSNYVSNYLNRELNNPKYKNWENTLNEITEKFNQENGSEIVRFFKNIDKMKGWVKDTRLANYKLGIEEMIDSYNHKLADSVEEYLNQTSIAEPDYETIFTLLTDSETDYGYVKNAKGKSFKLNPISRVKFLQSNDKVLRKNTYLQWNKALNHNKESLANLLFQKFRETATEAKIRKYSSAVNMLTNGDKVSDDLLQKLFAKVSSLKPTIKKYHQAWKQFYKLRFNENMDMKTDSMRKLVDVKTKYSIEEMNELVLEALKPFGDEYYSTVKKAINENWIDYMTIENKTSGAYSIGSTYGIDKKYILMNYDGELSSVETLAHELGHSLHSYFADKNNDLRNSQYPIFLAEIASIFNEQMLYNHLLKISDNDKFKFQLLDSMINGFIGTVHRQTLWANYEYNLYQGIENFSVNSSYESISKLYWENLKKYSSNVKKYKANEMIACVQVPHFYYGFYVYKYAIGQLAANYFFAKYQQEGEEYLQYYINNFLSKGGSDWPLNILKNVGVDLTNDEFYEIGFTYFEKLVNEYIKLGKKIFKNKK